MESFDLNTLVAYVDGELDAQEAAAVEAFLARSEEARESVRILRETATLARAALNGPMNETVPERLLATVADHRAAPRSPHRGSRGWRIAGWAVVASVVLSLGVAGGWIGARLGDDRAEHAALARAAARAETIARARQEALETKVSGSEVAWRSPDGGGYGTVRPVRTYRGKDGRFCREYRQDTLSGGVRETRLGVACRDSDGVWKVRFEMIPGATEEMAP